MSTKKSNFVVPSVMSFVIPVYTNPMTDPTTNPMTTPTTKLQTNPTTTPTPKLQTNPTTTPTPKLQTKPTTNPTTKLQTNPTTNPTTNPKNNDFRTNGSRTIESRNAESRTVDLVVTQLRFDILIENINFMKVINALISQNSKSSQITQNSKSTQNSQNIQSTQSSQTFQSPQSSQSTQSSQNFKNISFAFKKKYGVSPITFAFYNRKLEMIKPLILAGSGVSISEMIPLELSRRFPGKVDHFVLDQNAILNEQCLIKTKMNKACGLGPGVLITILKGRTDPSSYIYEQRFSDKFMKIIMSEFADCFSLVFKSFLKFDLLRSQSSEEFKIYGNIWRSGVNSETKQETKQETRQETKQEAKPKQNIPPENIANLKKYAEIFDDAWNFLKLEYGGFSSPDMKIRKEQWRSARRKHIYVGSVVPCVVPRVKACVDNKKLH